MALEHSLPGLRADVNRPLAAHAWDRVPHDFYVEPTWVSQRLFAVEGFMGCVWDPASGIGRIPEAAGIAGYRMIATDLIDRGYSKLDAVVDFLHCERGVENVVCNPPYSIFRPFAEHALKLATDKVAMIWLTRRLNAAHWLQRTPLARIYLLTPRPSMPPGDVVLAGEKPGGGTQDFCWLVWERDYAESPTVHWLARRP
jgi:hypothetical protein